MISKPSNWVISVGVNNAQNFPPLKCAHFDAIDVFNIMTQNWGCNSKQRILLINNEATTNNINTAINEILMRLADEDDRIFIYLSGHVYQYKDIIGFFATSDYCKEKRNFGINLRSLRYLVEDSKAKYIMVIIDGCSSGIIGQGLNKLKPHWFYFTTGEMQSQIRTKFFITAASSGKYAYEKEGKRNSLFCEIFLGTISPFIKNRESLSTSLFYELLVKMANEQCIEPVKSGIEVGYSTFINSNINNLILKSEEIKSYLPEWIVNIFMNCRNDKFPLENDKSLFVKDNNFPDGSRLKIGQVIKKSWRIRNVGSVSWKNRFVKMLGDFRGAGRIHCNSMTPIPDAEPNQEIDIEIELTMPDNPCSVYAEFKMTDSSGTQLFPNQRGLYVTFDIIDESDQKSDESSPTEENNGCLVTTVYGDIYSSEVKILNSFKDNVLVKTKLGTQLVHLYYSGYGKKIANFVKSYLSFIVPMIRKLLDKLINLILSKRRKIL